VTPPHKSRIRRTVSPEITIHLTSLDTTGKKIGSGNRIFETAAKKKRKKLKSHQNGIDFPC